MPLADVMSATMTTNVTHDVYTFTECWMLVKMVGENAGCLDYGVGDVC